MLISSRSLQKEMDAASAAKRYSRDPLAHNQFAVQDNNDGDNGDNNNGSNNNGNNNNNNDGISEHESDCEVIDEKLDIEMETQGNGNGNGNGNSNLNQDWNVIFSMGDFTLRLIELDSGKDIHANLNRVSKLFQSTAAKIRIKDLQHSFINQNGFNTMRQSGTGVVLRILFGCVNEISKEINENENELELENVNVNCDFDFCDCYLCNRYYPTPAPTPAPTPGTTSSTTTVDFERIDSGLSGIKILTCRPGVGAVNVRGEEQEAELFSMLFIFVDIILAPKSFVFSLPLVFALFFFFSTRCFTNTCTKYY